VDGDMLVEESFCSFGGLRIMKLCAAAKNIIKSPFNSKHISLLYHPFRFCAAYSRYRWFSVASMSSSAVYSSLQQELSSLNVSGYIVPAADSHQSEYTAESDKRISAVTNFTGSAGTALVINQSLLPHIKSKLWTDGRYFLQANNQLNPAQFELMKSGVSDTPRLEEFLLQNFPENSVVGIDPTLMNISQYNLLRETFKNKLELVPIAQNLIDKAWANRPPAPQKPIFPLADKFTGEKTAQKLAKIREKLQSKQCKAIIIAALDEVAWLLNCRGSDISYNPVFFAYAVVTLEKLVLYIDNNKLTEEVRQHLEEQLGGEAKSLEIKPYLGALSAIQASLEPELSSEGKIWLDFNKTNYAIYKLFSADSVYSADSPISLLKSIKNISELNGLRSAHKRDAAAMCNWLFWLEKTIKPNESGQNEVTIAEKLADFRSKQADFFDLSFATIAGSGPNGAIIHYKAEEKTAAPVNTENLLLVDSGAQFLDGTTDITRTIHLGKPSERERECFTRVLKGYLALGRAVFPFGTTGTQLDILARSNLWQIGLDYNHGTGHGVGSFLCVHEGPQGISNTSRNVTAASTPFHPGMTTSNEPGYYEEGKFGIRIESILVCVEAQTPNKFNNKQYLTFETITLVPIQHKLIIVDMLTAEEIAQIDQFHEEVREIVSPLVESEEVKQWLHEQTKPLQQRK
jgi:Xaa-Pro aminopeptidase